MSLKTIKLTHNMLRSLLAIVALGTISTVTLAATEGSRSSKSISFANSTEIDKAAKDEQLNKAETDVMTALVKKGFREETTTQKTLPTGVYSETISYSSEEISIFDASTELVSDFDFDGFYHRFSVAIDADTIHNTSYVYAKLYLSYEGGPWNHYATSNAYHIYGDSAQDTFVIETELADGFPTGYYDVRIELYDADYGDWLVSYGPYDNPSLSTLPLEDSYYDDEYIDNDYYIETGVAISAGSMGWMLLMLPALLVTARVFSKYKTSNKAA